MSRPIITLTTDFGQEDSYVAQMKGVMLGINSRVQLVDVTHAIPPQDVRRAAAVLDEAVAVFPDRTIHLVVVDPGVGTERRLVAVEMGPQRFVAPDNGVLSTISRRWSPARCIRLTQKSFWRQSVSRTFQGRDIMGPIAAHWSLGIDPAEFGELLETDLLDLPSRSPEQLPDGIGGEVLWSDSFGNLITNIEASELPEADRSRLIVEIGDQRIIGIDRCYAERPEGTLMAVVGSSGRLELAMNRDSAAEKLNIRPGQRVRVIGFKLPIEK